jgi:hypothetical protein
MSKKFEIVESGKTFWGKQKYTIREKQDNSGAGCLLILAILVFALPGGLIMLFGFILFSLLIKFKFSPNVGLTISENEDLRERKFDLWLKVNLAINGLITLALTYYYYSELFNSDEDISELIWLCILGLVCWIVWFQLVSNYDKYFFK